MGSFIVSAYTLFYAEDFCRYLLIAVFIAGSIIWHSLFSTGMHFFGVFGGGHSDDKPSSSGTNTNLQQEVLIKTSYGCGFVNSPRQGLIVYSPPKFPI